MSHEQQVEIIMDALQDKYWVWVANNYSYHHLLRVSVEQQHHLGLIDMGRRIQMECGTKLVVTPILYKKTLKNGIKHTELGNLRFVTLEQYNKDAEIYTYHYLCGKCLERIEEKTTSVPFEFTYDEDPHYEKRFRLIERFNT